MSKVAKQIIIILILLLGVSVFFALSSLSQKTALQQSSDNLAAQVSQLQEKEMRQLEASKALERQLNDAQDAQKRVQRQLDELNGQVTALQGERDDWKSRVDSLREERDTLIAQLQEAQSKPQPAAQPVVTMPQMPEFSADEAEDRYWAAVLKEKAALEVRLAEFEGQLSQGVIELEELKKKNSDMSMELSQLNSDKEEIVRQLKHSEDLVNTLSLDLAREKNDKRYVTDRVDSLKEENAQLRGQVKELSAAKIGLEKSISALKEDKEEIERALIETESIIQNRINEVLEIKRTLDRRLNPEAALNQPQEVELPPIIVSANAARQVADAPVGIGPNGRVLSINADNNFIIVDLGEQSGISAGDTLGVYRQDKYIAGVEIIQVRKDISAADIKSENARIQVGDMVR